MNGCKKSGEKREKRREKERKENILGCIYEAGIIYSRSHRFFNI